jgi:hypothetical protein
MRVFFLALVFFALISESHSASAFSSDVENMELEFEPTVPLIPVRAEPEPRTQSNPWSKLSGRDMFGRRRGRAPSRDREYSKSRSFSSSGDDSYPETNNWQEESGFTLESEFHF